MGMADVRKAFQSGLNGKAECQLATMGYAQGGKQQVLTFLVLPHGSTSAPTELTESVSANTNLVAHAKTMAANYIATLS